MVLVLSIMVFLNVVGISATEMRKNLSIISVIFRPGSHFLAFLVRRLLLFDMNWNRTLSRELIYLMK